MGSGGSIGASFKRRLRRGFLFMKQSNGQFRPSEFKVVAVRRCRFRDERPTLDTPVEAARYWSQNIDGDDLDAARECMVALLLDVRGRLIGHVKLAVGTKDTVLVNKAEVFRASVIANASAIVLMHNHPSGDPEPSVTDVSVTSDLRRAGRLINVEVLDHVIMGLPSLEGSPGFVSMKQLGYFTDPPSGKRSRKARRSRRAGAR